MVSGLVLALAVTPAAQVKAGLTYEGATVIADTIMPDLVAEFTAATGVKFDKISDAGADKGLIAVAEGRADVGGLSRAPSREEKIQKLYFQTIGYDAIGIFVNAKNPVTNLSKEQIKGIFTGKIMYWKEVGGSAGKILVVTENKKTGRGTFKVFKETALDGAEYGPAKEIDLARDGVAYVATNPNAITYASLCFMADGTKSVTVEKIEPTTRNVKTGIYPFSRPLFLIAKTIPTGDLKKFFDFVMGAGQKIIAKKFIPLFIPGE